MSTTVLPAGIAEAPLLADVLPARKLRGKVGMFIYRHPTIFAGGLLLAIIVSVAIFAPLTGSGHDLGAP